MRSGIRDAFKEPDEKGSQGGEDGMMNGDLSRAVWRKSARSGGEGNCVEVADNLPGSVAVRDSKNPSGPALRFGHDTWDTFTSKVKNGQYELQ
jgi:hypothetical protein